MENSKYTALSIKAKPNKEIINFITSNFKKEKIILDFGAGKGRHSKALRDLGYRVWSYDPYNFVKEYNDGFSNIVNNIRYLSFDVVFSAYVLNVVNKNLFEYTIKDMEKYVNKGGIVFHKVREDSSLKKKIKNSNLEAVPGKCGSIQRLVTKKEFDCLGYCKKSNIYFKKF